MHYKVKAKKEFVILAEQSMSHSNNYISWPHYHVGNLDSVGNNDNKNLYTGVYILASDAVIKSQRS